MIIHVAKDLPALLHGRVLEAGFGEGVNFTLRRILRCLLVGVILLHRSCFLGLSNSVKDVEHDLVTFGSLCVRDNFLLNLVKRHLFFLVDLERLPLVEQHRVSTYLNVLVTPKASVSGAQIKHVLDPVVRKKPLEDNLAFINWRTSVDLYTESWVFLLLRRLMLLSDLLGLFLLSGLYEIVGGKLLLGVLPVVVPLLDAGVELLVHLLQVLGEL